MAILAAGSCIGRDTPSNELVIRAVREFESMPALRITLEQAMRLFGLDRLTCLNVLNELVDTHVVYRDHSGRYCSTGCSTLHG